MEIGMSAYSNNPSNLNFLGQVGFKFNLTRSPNFDFFIQKVDFPGVTLTPAEVPNPFVKTPIPGDHMDYESLKLTFKLDEDLRGYFEIYNWMKALGKPENFNQSANIYSRKAGDPNTVFSDGSLTILDANLNSNININFYDMLPTYLSGFTLQTDATDIQFITARMEFRYRMYDYSYVNKGYINPYGNT
jgi:hypothetical protein